MFIFFTIKNVFENDDFILQINETLATSLMSNLIKNAFVHNIDNGTIDLIFDKNEMIISNSGKTNKLNEKTIFKEYFHGSNDINSTGLGLTLVDTICKNLP